MSFVIEPHELDDIDFSQASIYLDACFLLAALDDTDPRADDIADFVDQWADNNITLGISGLTFSEVTGALFKNTVLKSLQTYHENKDRLSQGRTLTAEQQRDIVDANSARYLYNIAKTNGILSSYQKRVSVNVSELMKLAKTSTDKRVLLDCYYTTAIQVYKELIRELEETFGFHIVTVPVRQTEYDAAQVYMGLFQLDPPDALHLACAQSNHFNFLATLDGDFVHSLYGRTSSMTTRIVKIA